MMILINRQQFLILLSLVFSQTRNLTSHPRSSVARALYKSDSAVFICQSPKACQLRGHKLKLSRILK